MLDLGAEIAPRFFTLFLLVSAVVSTAHADPIVPSYTVTDLGSGTITLSAGNGNTVPGNPYGWSLSSSLWTAANGGQVVSVSNGQAVYPFALTPAAPLTPYQGSMTGFPLAQPAPVNDPATYGNPINAYSVVYSPLMNANGVVVAIDSAGVFGHSGTESAYYVQRNPDGSWGAPGVIWSGNNQFGQGPVVGGVTLAGINNLNQVVGTMNVDPRYSINNAVLYDITTHRLTNLSALPVLANYLNVLPIAIDDQGRILVDADPVRWGTAKQTLLLTPAGVTSDPHLVPAPEPGSLAVMALAMAAFAARGIGERRRRR